MNRCLCYTALMSLCVQMESVREREQPRTSVNLGCKPDTQLVLYDPSKLLPLHRPKLRYEICNRTIEIEQEWAELGLSGVVWDAAPFLAYYLEKSPSTIQGKRVIELGAGTGLVGMVSNMLGAREVIVTDMKTTSAERNMRLNHHNLINDCIKVSHLEWGKDISHFNPPFDVILAADVIYVEEGFDPLLNTLSQLSDASTTILLSCAHRYDWVEKFLARVAVGNKLRPFIVTSQGNISIYQLVKIL